MTTPHVSTIRFMRVPAGLSLFLCATLVLLLPSLAAGQYPPPPQSPAPASEEQAVYASDEVPAHLAVVDGTATLERDGRAEDAVENLPLLAGDRLRTARGRVEILFADGSAVDVDEYSDVDLLSDSLMRLLAGRIRVSMARTGSDLSDARLEYRVDTVAGSVLIHSAGDYGISLTSATREPVIDLAVWRGSAELQNAIDRILVRAGTHSYATARSEPSRPYGFNSAVGDAFDRWTQDQRDARFGAASARYLPADLRYYGGAFDQYGSWAYEPGYGQVWYPRVDVGWRPYYSGRWSFFARFGWFWIGADRWSWPTHHYGRWGLSGASRWFWVPDRRWAPAWVSWGYSPGYVSWCPLGVNGYPVVSLVSVQYSRGWSILPSRHFTPNVIVPRYVVDGRSYGASARAAAIVRNAAPVWRGETGRSALPLRGPGASRLSGTRPEGTRLEGTRSYGVRPGGIETGRAVPRNTTRPAGPALRGPESTAPRSWQSTDPAAASRRAPGNPVYGSRLEPRGSLPPRTDMIGRPAPQQSAPTGPSYSRPPYGNAVPRLYSRPSPPQPFGAGREVSRPAPQMREPGIAPRVAPPSSQGAPPRVAPPSRARPSESGDSGRAVERRGRRN